MNINVLLVIVVAYIVLLSPIPSYCQYQRWNDTLSYNIDTTGNTHSSLFTIVGGVGFQVTAMNYTDYFSGISSFDITTGKEIQFFDGHYLRTSASSTDKFTSLIGDNKNNLIFAGFGKKVLVFDIKLNLLDVQELPSVNLTSYDVISKGVAINGFAYFSTSCGVRGVTVEGKKLKLGNLAPFPTGCVGPNAAYYSYVAINGVDEIAVLTMVINAYNYIVYNITSTGDLNYKRIDLGYTKTASLEAQSDPAWIDNTILFTGNACGFSSCGGNRATSPWLYWKNSSIETTWEKKNST